MTRLTKFPLRVFFLGQLLLVIALVTSTAVSALTPSAQQIEQFKRLPPSEQQRLAAQMGVDLNSFITSDSNDSRVTMQLAEPVATPSKRPASHADDKAIVSAYRQQANHKAGKTSTAGPLRQFGYDLFSDNPDAFMPVIDVPPPNSYVLGPGDNIIIQLYGKANATYTLVIDRRGNIQFPELGPITVAGQTVEEMRANLQQAVSEQMIGVKASIAMGPLRSIRVFVLGEAVSPGSYTVSSLSTITNALFASGGVTPVGSLRDIQLKRNGSVVTRFDLYDLLLRGDTRADQRLMPGDVIFIPPIGSTVAVSGEIKRPAIYEIKQERTAAAVVKVAGGYLPDAYPRVSRIQRIDGNGDRTVLNVDLTSSSGAKTRLKDGDTLEVFSVLETLENIITLSGHVKRPGISQWQAHSKVTSLVPSVLSLLPGPDLEFALLKRETMPAREITVVPVYLGAAILDPYGPANISLKPRDELIVFNKSGGRVEQLAPLVEQLRKQGDKANLSRVVRIGGQVRAPGEYPLPLNMTAADLIKLAGGLNEKAYSLDAELTRVNYDAGDHQVVEHVIIDLTNAAQIESLILRPADELHIKRLPNYVGNEFVEVQGEVAFPGNYRIMRGEKLSDLLRRAGGLSEHALASAAIFQRQSLKLMEAERIREMRAKLETDIAISNLNEEKDSVAADDAQTLLNALNAIRPTGRMVIDLPAVIGGDERYDMPLRAGDVLTIPQVKAAVTVVGEVQFATSHLFEKNLSTHDYVEQSGGTTRAADKDRIYIVKANGSVEMPERSKWYKFSQSQLQPGDTIVVPINADHMRPLELWSNVSQIVYQVALGAAAVASF